MQNAFFNSKKILVIDKAPKEKNDRTWCFWEKEPGSFEEIIYCKWKQIDFFSNYFSARFDITPYQYKMIRGIDFYNYILQKAKQRNNIDFYYGNVQSVQTISGKAIASVDDTEFTADYIFNSILFDHSFTDHAAITNKKYYYLLQHFKGWIIETKENVFDAAVATFMDFRICKEGDTSFVYVLPVSSNRALVEYTVFSKQILPQEEYNTQLKNYISNYIRAGYTISEEEFGIIPMTSFPFAAGNGNIINIGTAGKQTKATTGFTFRFIQKHTHEIVNALLKGKHPRIGKTFTEKRFDLYDDTLLNILTNKKLKGDSIFADLFKKNPPQRVLKFLDNDTNLIEELKLMRTVPSAVFLRAALREMFK